MTDLIFIAVIVLFSIVGVFMFVCARKWKGVYEEYHRRNRFLADVGLPARGHDPTREILTGPMHSIDWLPLGLFMAALALITKLMGLYLVQVLGASGRTWLDPIIKPFEQLTCRLIGISSDREQDWKNTFAMLLSAWGVAHLLARFRGATSASLQSLGLEVDESRPRIQHRIVPPHEHDLAELHRGIAPALLLHGTLRSEPEYERCRSY